MYSFGIASVFGFCQMIAKRGRGLIMGRAGRKARVNVG